MIEILTTIINGIISKDSGLLDLFKGKESKLQEFQLKLVKELENANIRQVEVNKIEAQNPNIFVSGWRPAVGWVCVSALAYTYVIQPFLLVIISAFNINILLPVLDMSQLLTLLFAMLGMGGIRTYEKIKLNNTKKQ